MVRRLSMDKITLVKQLAALGWSLRRIQAETGIRRETVSKYLKGDLPKERKEEVSSSTCAAHHDFIVGALQSGLSAQRIYQDLVQTQRFEGSYSSVRRYAQKLKGKSKEVFSRVHTPPGEEAQVDFGQGAPTLRNGKWVRPALFVMVLSWSRHSYQEVVWKQDLETFIRCHERAFAFFGGVPTVIRLDNLKSGVLMAHLFEPELNPVYADFAKHCGFTPLPCLPRKPHHKGKVEAGVKYVQNNALQGRTFQTLEEQNAFLGRWSQETASLRTHGTTKQRVRAAYEEERSFLQLPPVPYEYFKTGTRRVHPDGHIEVDGAYYSVPHRLVGQSVTVHYTSEWVKALVASEPVAFHRKVQPGAFRTERDHFPAGKTRSFQEHLQKAVEGCKEIGPDCFNWAEEVVKARQRLSLRAIQGVLSLAKSYAKEAINRACSQALQIGSVRYHTVKLLCADEAPPVSQQHEILRTMEDYRHYLDAVEKGEWNGTNTDASQGN
jgi:transposase